MVTKWSRAIETSQREDGEIQFWIILPFSSLTMGIKLSEIRFLAPERVNYYIKDFLITWNIIYSKNQYHDYTYVESFEIDYAYLLKFYNIKTPPQQYTIFTTL